MQSTYTGIDTSAEERAEPAVPVWLADIADGRACPRTFPLAPTADLLVEGTDDLFPQTERLPRGGRVHFVAGRDATGLTTNTTYLNSLQIGDVLTDACGHADGYRFHDCLHLSFAMILGWSPVTRALMRSKRRSDPLLDGTEDGGRAIAVEEGVAALVFAHFAANSLLSARVSLWSPTAFEQVNQVVTDSAMLMSRPFAVADRSAEQWAAAIVTGLRAMTAATCTQGEIDLAFDVAANRWTILRGHAAGAFPVGGSTIGHCA